MKILMNRDDAAATIPHPPSEREKAELLDLFPTDDDFPSANDSPRISQSDIPLKRSSRISDNFHYYLVLVFRQWGLRHYTFDWNAPFDERYNQMMLQIFLMTFRQAIAMRVYGVPRIKLPHDDNQLGAMIYRHFKTLQGDYKKQQECPTYLTDRRQGNTYRKGSKQVSGSLGGS
jgi:hypothetical protein